MNNSDGEREVRIAANCSCGAKFKAKQELAGKRVKCPSCGHPLTVPGAEASAGPIRVACDCGREFRAKAELAGKQVKCPACSRPLAIPCTQAVVSLQSQAARASVTLPASPEGGAACPHCQAALPMNAVLCISCGYDLRTQQQTVTEYGQAVDDGWTGSGFWGRQFTVTKGEQGVPKLVLQRRFFWFAQLPKREYDLTNFREVNTSNADIHRTTADDYNEAAPPLVVGEKMRVHLIPKEGSREREVVFTFSGYYEGFFQVFHFNLLDLFRLAGDAHAPYATAHANYSILIDLIRSAYPIPLLPRY